MTPETKTLVMQVLKEKHEHDTYAIKGALFSLSLDQEQVERGRSQGARTRAMNNVAAQQRHIESLKADLAKLDAAIAELEAT
jgi:hypothetical protein